MRNILLVIAVAIAAFVLYRLWTAESPQDRKKPGDTPKGVLRKYVREGRNIGRKSGNTFDSFDFGGGK